MPFVEEPGAYWLLLSPMGFEFRRTIYDFKAAANEVRASKDPLRDVFAEGNIPRVPTATEAVELLESLAMKKGFWVKGYLSLNKHSVSQRDSVGFFMLYSEGSIRCIFYG